MSQDRREKIQAMLLERIEQVFAKYDETKGSDNAVGNANALECIAQALQAVGYPARDIIVGAYAAPARTDADNHCKPTCPCRKTEAPEARPANHQEKNLTLKNVGIDLVSDRYVSPQVAAELAPLLDERRELRRLVQRLLGCDHDADLISALKSRLSETLP